VQGQGLHPQGRGPRQDKTTSFTDAGASTSMSVSLISIHYTVYRTWVQGPK